MRRRRTSQLGLDQLDTKFYLRERERGREGGRKWGLSKAETPAGNDKEAEGGVLSIQSKYRAQSSSQSGKWKREMKEFSWNMPAGWNLCQHLSLPSSLIGYRIGHEMGTGFSSWHSIDGRLDDNNIQLEPDSSFNWNLGKSIESNSLLVWFVCDYWQWNGQFIVRDLWLASTLIPV